MAHKDPPPTPQRPNAGANLFDHVFKKTEWRLVHPHTATRRLVRILRDIGPDQPRPPEILGWISSGRRQTHKVEFGLPVFDWPEFDDAVLAATVASLFTHRFFNGSRFMSVHLCIGVDIQSPHSRDQD
jgi:hypothetical protein